MEDLQPYRRRVVESVRLLAAEPDVQIGALPAFVHIPDELALTFHYEWEMFRERLLAGGLVTKAQGAVLDRIDSFLSRMSLHGDLSTEGLWTVDGVRTSPHWRAVRAMAEKALQLMGEPTGEPDLFWIAYVPARGESEQ